MTLWHLHIPKCGGSSLDTILKREYPDWRSIKIWKQTPPDTWQGIWGTPQEVNQASCVAGHISFGWLNMLARNLPENERRNTSYPTVITMLRNPVARLLSLYLFWKEVPQAYRPLLRTISFEEFVFTRRKDWRFLDNDMTRRISGMSGEIKYAHLLNAKKNLQHVPMIGMLERFDESVSRWEEMFGWSSAEYRFVKMRCGSEKELKYSDLDSGLVERIVERQKYDYELYQYALERDWK